MGPMESEGALLISQRQTARKTFEAAKEMTHDNRHH
jgi:hypothetical protein